MCVGALLRVLCFRYLGPCYTFRLAILKGHKLVTDGPYSVVRHPSYAAGSLVNIGTVISLLGPGSVYTELQLWQNPVSCAGGIAQLAMIVYIGVVIGVRVPQEDMIIKDEFHNEWLAWAKRTPFCLVPGIY